MPYKMMVQLIFAMTLLLTVEVFCLAQEQVGPRDTGGDGPALQEAPPAQGGDSMTDPNAPHPVVADLLTGVGVDGIGPDQPGGYGSGLSGVSSDVMPAVDIDKDVEQASKDAINSGRDQQVQAGSPNNARGSPNQQNPNQNQYPLADPGVGNNIANNPMGAGLAGGVPGVVPDATNTFGVPAIPPMAEFTLPPTPPPPSELPSQPKSNTDSTKSDPPPHVPGGGLSPETTAYIIGFGLSALILLLSSILAAILFSYRRNSLDRKDDRIKRRSETTAMDLESAIDSARDPAGGRRCCSCHSAGV